MKAIRGFHPAGVLRTSNFAPGEIVDKERRSRDAGSWHNVHGLPLSANNFNN